MISGITGEEFNADIFIGPVYYQRLRHMVADKFQVTSCSCSSASVPNACFAAIKPAPGAWPTSPVLDVTKCCIQQPSRCLAAAPPSGSGVL